MSRKKIKLIDAIQKILIELVQQKRVSQRSISERSGISRYKVSQLIERKPGTLIDTLKIDETYKILDFINGSEHSAEIIKNLDKECRSVLSAFNAVSDQEDKKYCDLFDELIEDFDNAVILMMASGKSTKDDIELNILPHNRYKIDQLIRREIIEEVEGFVRIKNADYISFPPKVLQFHLPQLISNFFSPKRVSSKTCSISLAYGSVSQEGQKKINQLSQDLINQVDEIIQSNPGKIPAFCGTVVDRFNSSI